MAMEKRLKISAKLFEAHRALPEEWDSAEPKLLEAHRAAPDGPLTIKIQDKFVIEVRRDEEGNIYLEQKEE